MYTVGEMARLHNIPVKTLRYYDTIDLFKPAEVNPVSGYRYYRLEQCEMLNSIIFLRAHGFSIARIKEHLHKRGLKDFVSELKIQKEIYQKEIKRLQQASFSLTERITELDRLSDGITFGRISEIDKPARSILRLKRFFSSNDELELNLIDLERLSKPGSFRMIGRVGLTVSCEDLENGIYNRFNGLFILDPHPGKGKFVEKIPQGKVISVFINAGDHSQSRNFYPELLSYIRTKGYSVRGDAIERVISDMFITHDEKEYIMEIEIPVSDY